MQCMPNLQVLCLSPCLGSWCQPLHPIVSLLPVHVPLEMLFPEELSMEDPRGRKGTMSMEATNITIHACIRYSTLWNSLVMKNTSSHTLVAMLGSAPFLSRMSTTSVWPLLLAVYSGLVPVCIVHKNCHILNSVSSNYVIGLFKDPLHSLATHRTHVLVHAAWKGCMYVAAYTHTYM